MTEEKKHYDLLIKIESDPELQTVRVTDFEIIDTMEPDTKSKKILDYLKSQLAIAEEEKKALEGTILNPLDHESRQENAVTSRVFYRLKGIVQAVEFMQ